MTYYDQKIKEINDELESIAASTEERTTEQRDRLNQLRSRRKLIERLKTNYTQLPLFAVEDDVREQIDYNALVGCQGSCEEDRDLVDSIVALIAEKLHDKTTSNDTKERYLNLQSFHVEYIVESVKKYNKEIKNPKRFLEKTLYNAVFSEAAAMVNLFSTTYQFPGSDLY